jgi:hypothetical protein
MLIISIMGGGLTTTRLKPIAEASSVMCSLIIPEYDLEDPQPYPGDIQPGEYEGNELVQLLRDHLTHRPIFQIGSHSNK